MFCNCDASSTYYFNQILSIFSSVICFVIKKKPKKNLSLDVDKLSLKKRCPILRHSANTIEFSTTQELSLYPLKVKTNFRLKLLGRE